MNIFATIDLIARAGGGGSDSGGGGGGDIVAAITYFPSYWLAKFIKKLLPRHQAMTVTLLGGAVFSVGLLIIPSLFDYSGVGFYFTILMIIGLWLGWYAAMFGFWEKVSKRLKRADKQHAKALAEDDAWDETSLREIVTTTFMRFQADWSRRDTRAFGEYMTVEYNQHMSYVLLALANMNRVNVVEHPEIIKMDLSMISDHDDNAKDSFSMFIEAKAHDRIYDETTQTDLYNDDNSFIEEWTFTRSNSTWLLSGIRQSTEEAGAYEKSIAEFASQNSMYFSLDWGWLLLPQGGQCMKEGRFGVSDINNHVIGMYGDILMQLYTYNSNPKKADKNTMYLVGQITVPKEYGGIIIRQNKGFFGDLGWGPQGYTQHKMEWPDFNKRYKLYATDADQLASFELLNPGFMAFLYDNFKDMNIEVVGNDVYFYVEHSSTEHNYELLLEVLKRAHKELKL